MVSAACAALAATAAWRNAYLSRRQWLASQAPILVGQIVAGGQVELQITNVGAGLARQPRFCVIVGDEYVVGYAGPAFGSILKSGEERRIRTELSTRTGKATGVITCLDSADRIHVFSLKGDHSVYRLRGRAEDALDPLREMRRQRPEVDLNALRVVRGASSERRPAR